MELILAILGAGPIGYFTPTRGGGLRLYLLVWALVFPIQTVVVHSNGDLDWTYFVFNVPILAAGVGLNLAGSAVAERRRGPSEESDHQEDLGAARSSAKVPSAKVPLD